MKMKNGQPLEIEREVPGPREEFSAHEIRAAVTRWEARKGLTPLPSFYDRTVKARAALKAARERMKRK